jgi:hypothetical protein
MFSFNQEDKGKDHGRCNNEKNKTTRNKTRRGPKALR